MQVYRLAKQAYSVLDGEGARLYGGRWNSPGHAVVYTAGSRALALLELLVHTELDTMPSGMVLLTVEVPERIVVEELRPLPRAWHRLPAPPACHKAGDLWVASGRSAVLAVPSVVIHKEHNYLINPGHPDSRAIKVVKREPFSFDTRLFGESS
jgi:RES domain-containing protein